MAKYLARKYKAKVILSSGPQEIEQINNVNKLMENPLPALVTNLKNLAAVINRCQLFISNDSGPMHMAAALKIPVVCLFGPSDATRWHPWETSYTLVRKDIECSPCDQKGCPRFKNNQPYCMSLIELEDVLEAVSQQLK